MYTLYTFRWAISQARKLNISRFLITHISGSLRNRTGSYTSYLKTYFKPHKCIAMYVPCGMFGDVICTYMCMLLISAGWANRKPIGSVHNYDVTLAAPGAPQQTAAASARRGLKRALHRRRSDTATECTNAIQFNSILFILLRRDRITYIGTKWYLAII